MAIGQHQRGRQNMIFLRWMSDYVHCPVRDLFCLMAPPKLVDQHCQSSSWSSLSGGQIYSNQFYLKRTDRFTRKMSNEDEEVGRRRQIGFQLVSQGSTRERLVVGTRVTQIESITKPVRIQL